MASGRGSTLSFSAAAAWVVLGVLELLRLGDATIPAGALRACALVALPLSIAAALIAAVDALRGPPIVAFAPETGALFAPGDARLIRRAAQHRGALGGAGHVRRAPLIFQAIGWSAAALAAAGALACAGRDGGCGLAALAVVPVAAALLVPATPFFYREARGGTVIAYPPDAAFRIVRDGAGDRDGEMAEARR